MADDYLGEFEHLVLLAVMQLRDDAYGVPIRRLIAERAEREVSFGAVYSTLRRLDAKGHVTFREEPTEGGAGGRPRRVAQITQSGVRAVEASRRRLRRMAEAVGETAL
jgi:DNA-binding PadR family transcriptional regulator